jgi:hypothetical protein
MNQRSAFITTIATAAIAASAFATDRFSLSELRVLAAGVIASNVNPYNIPPSVIAAFAEVESSGRPFITGDHGKAWGLFQFHIGRWVECGGRRSEWGVASPARQTEVMLRAVNKYAAWGIRANAPDRLTWVANCHNLGHGSTTLTPYARKVSSVVAVQHRD